MIIKCEMTVAQLRQAYGDGQRLFEGTEFIGEGEFATLSGLDLQGAEFRKCWFHSAIFENVNLRGAIFRNCNLKCVLLESCDLSDSTWESCVVCSIEMSHSESSNLQASRLEAYGAEIENAISFVEYATRRLGSAH